METNTTDCTEEGYNIKELREAQENEFAAESESAHDDMDDEYIIQDGLLYSVKPPRRSIIC